VVVVRRGHFKKFGRDRMLSHIQRDSATPSSKLVNLGMSHQPCTSFAGEVPGPTEVCSAEREREREREREGS
jgi:hypothetical protein